MNPIRVSVVIPAYNEEKLLARCLVSLVNQSVKPYEIIVVDNNSTDTTAAIAKMHGAVVISETRQGIAWARDAGFAKASGDIIARLDADCIAPPEWIEIISNYYQKQSLGSSSAITGTGFYTTRSALTGKILGTITTTGYNAGNQLMIGNVALFGSCMAFPRSWWEAIKDTVCRDSGTIHEDIDLSVHLLKNNYGIVKLPKFYTYIDSRTLHEPFKKTLWRFKIWPRSARRHRQASKQSRLK